MCAVTPVNSSYFPKNFSIKISPQTTVTASAGAKFEYYNPPYGVISLGEYAATFTVKGANGENFTINCQAPYDDSPTGNSLAAYLPGYGQFANEGINNGGWGDGYISNTAGKKSMANSIASTGLSLGSFGGYAVVDFGEEGVPNSNKNKYGIDFIVYGNAFVGNSEPGGVQVSKDGTTWYDIAGSRHYMDDTVWDCEATYTNPHPEDNVPGAVAPVSGTYMGTTDRRYTLREVARPGMNPATSDVTVVHNTWHGHSWFPLAANYFGIRKAGDAPLANYLAYDFANYNAAANQLKLKGVKTSFARTSTGGNDHQFGYCDVHPNGNNYGVAANPYTAQPSTAGGDGIDISWAVNPDGTPANLDSIRYVRVYTGVATMNPTPIFGEVSTELTGVYKVTPQATAVGVSSAPGVYGRGSGSGVISHSNGGCTTVTAENGQIHWLVVTPPESDRMYINGKKVKGIQMGGNVFAYPVDVYVAANEEKYIQIIYQVEDKEPYITVFKITR